MLIIRMTGNDPDYCETLRKFYGTYFKTLLTNFSVGSKGYYTGLIAPAILISGAIIVFFVIMS